MNEPLNERQKRVQEAKKATLRKQNNKQYLQAGIVAVVALALILGGAFLFANYQKSNPTANSTPENISGYSLKVGENDAPAKVVIYEDFLCPYCGLLETSVREQLQAAIDSGAAQVEYRPFNLLGRINDYPIRSANAFAVVADSSGVEVAKKFHDLLYANQPSEEQTAPDNEWLIDLAVEAGAKEDDIRKGIEDLQFEDWVQDATTAALEDNVQGTPTVRVNGDNIEGETLQDIINNLLTAIDEAQTKNLDNTEEPSEETQPNGEQDNQGSSSTEETGSTLED